MGAPQRRAVAAAGESLWRAAGHRKRAGANWWRSWRASGCRPTRVSSASACRPTRARGSPDVDSPPAFEAMPSGSRRAACTGHGSQSTRIGRLPQRSSALDQAASRCTAGASAASALGTTADAETIAARCRGRAGHSPSRGCVQRRAWQEKLGLAICNRPSVNQGLSSEESEESP
eukprot:2444656-Prymnesium_polylepis.1